MKKWKLFLEEYKDLVKDNEIINTPLYEQEEWDLIVSKTEIEAYLSSENAVQVSLSPDQKDSLTMKRFDAIEAPNQNAFVINTGGSIWAVDFVPRRDKENTQYLAIGGYKSTDEQHLLGDDSNYHSMIQIWRYDGSRKVSTPPKLDMCILHEFGIITELKWCPLSSCDEEGKLGILAVIIGDGSVYILVIPHPNRVRQQRGLKEDNVIYLIIKKPRFVLKLPKSYNLCLSWCQGLLACGTLEGTIVVWDISSSLRAQQPVLLAHIPEVGKAGIHSICWTSPLDRPFLLSADMAGFVYVHDLRDPFLKHEVTRTRSMHVPLSGVGHHLEGFLYGDSEGNCRLNATFHSKKSIPMTYSGYGHIWSIDFCHFCQKVASVSSTGDVLYQLRCDNKIFHYLKTTQADLSSAKDYQNALIDPVASLHKVAWNPNETAHKWVASGGKAGLCRLDIVK
ncbi:hypothetical protein G6F46_000176 [Rhizopus delemar]|uniref:Uncharacterized protein n=2 Tax=Rhizopus TaxID=4842 RepID=A0A9P6ZD87_9FUNG|nr:hypothetical protein G6F55_000038 [Rhizopus delemar]KAG1553916.1 hypothetical protein G6F51_000293 [Rhizopus arrhizus]KAG1504991.1 hypothetical protein G6F54_000621 [Rhizopus delemar]KAG1518376.1 hypothetical protein G6F53_000639 [Rhizopus delemar]KAG1528538.1 hypothetical protein G6F52_000553 [Rhizopus delemar]